MPQMRECELCEGSGVNCLMMERPHLGAPTSKPCDCTGGEVLVTASDIEDDEHGDGWGNRWVRAIWRQRGWRLSHEGEGWFAVCMEGWATGLGTTPHEAMLRALAAMLGTGDE